MEHRWYKRTATNFTVSVSQNGQFLFLGRVANISPEGMFIEAPSEHNIVADDTIKITSYSRDNNKNTKSFKALVIHTQSNGIGVMLHRADIGISAELLKQSSH